MFKYILLFFCLKYSTAIFSQQKTIDSLNLLLKKAPNDSMRSELLLGIINGELVDNWEPYNQSLIKIAEKNTVHCKSNSQTCVYFKKILASAISNIGFIRSNEGKPQLALTYFMQSLQIQKDINDKQGQSLTMTNIAFIHKSIGDIANSLNWELAAIKIKEEIGDTTGTNMAYSLNNIATIYKKQGLKDKAIEYYEKSLLCFKKSNFKEGIGLVLNNIAAFYRDYGDTANAIYYLNKSLLIREEINDKKGVSNALCNIGGIWLNKNVDSSIHYYKRAIKLHAEINEKDGFTSCLSGISLAYLKKGMYADAIQYANKALLISKEIGYPQNICQSAQVLYKIHKIKGQSQKALAYFELFITMRDSINNSDTRKASVKSQLKYEYEKKAAADSVRVVEEKKLTQVKLKQEKVQRYYLYTGLGLVGVFALFMVNRYRVTNNQKKLIELQKQEVEKQKYLVDEKQKEILSSIRYARRIQQSLLPSNTYISRNLKK